MESGHGGRKTPKMERESLRLPLGEEARSGMFVRLSESETWNNMRELGGGVNGMRRTSRPVALGCLHRTRHRLPKHHYDR